MYRKIATRALLLGGIASLAVYPMAAAAQAAGNDAGSDIIVTARRVEERLQDVPISITVYNQEQLTNRNIVNASDLGTYTPSLSVNQKYGPERSSFVIRGFVQETATAPSVGVYFADVPMPQVFGSTTAGAAAPVGSFVDLQNVQVLKGPQGTLFGRNTTGGAVLLVPQKPTDKFEGYIEGSAGNYDMWRGQGVLNVPLSDTFKVRVVVDRQKRDGYQVNHSGIGPDRYGNIDYFAGRLGILGDLTPDIENYTLFTYSRSKTAGFALRAAGCDINDPASPFHLGKLTLIGAAGCAQLARADARGDGAWDVDVNNPNPLQKQEQWSVINTTTLKASDTLTIKNIVSYTQFRESSAFNLYGDDSFVPALAGIPASAVGQQIRVSQTLNVPGYDSDNAGSVTEELQFQGRTENGGLNWQAGGYFERSRPLGWNLGPTAGQLYCSSAAVGAPSCANPLYSGPQPPYANNAILYNWTKQSFDDTGVYAQATVKVSEKFGVTGGVRYTWDQTRLLAEYVRQRFPTSGSYQVCNDSFRYPKNGPYPNDTATVIGTGGKLVTQPDQCAVNLVQKSNKPTWLIEADFRPSNDMMIYGKWVRGYRAGGLNPLNVGLEAWKPETVDTYELGAKTSFHGGISGYLNITGFYNDFRNQQIVGSAVGLPGTGISGIAAILNAGKSRMYGVEFDGSATLFNSLRLDVGYTYLNTKVVSFVGLTNVAGAMVLLPPAGSPYGPITPNAKVGDPLPLSPKNRVTVTGTYTLPLSEDIGKISIGATLTYTDKQLATRQTGAQFMYFPSSTLLDLNLNWKNVANSPFDLSAFVTNVTNKAVPVSTSQTYLYFGYETRGYAPPRIWGMRVRYSFGK
jgi:iron complex outermembrane recepter protein